MLKIMISSIETYDEEKNEFINSKEQTLELEHSLISISKWEAQYNKPYLSTEKTYLETIDYIKCMTINKVSDTVYNCLTNQQMESIIQYIEAPMTATTITRANTKPSRKKITSESIYYSMISYSIPFECEKWHLNRLLTLINICDIENSPQKKMSKREVMQHNKTINDERKARMNTRG
jgi:hypothetical protein